MAGHRTSQPNALSRRAAGELGRIDSAQAHKAIERVLRLVADRVLILHGSTHEDTTLGSGGDIDCVVDGLDPWWPLRLPDGWQLCQRFHYDMHASTWVLEHDGRAEWIDTMEDPRGIGRLSFPTAHLFDNGRQVHSAPPALRAAYLTAKRLYKRERDPDPWQTIGAIARDDPAGYLDALRAAVGSRLAHLAGPPALEGTPPDAKVSRQARAMLAANRLRSPARLGEAIALGVGRAFDRLTRPTGLVVLVAGPDGSGKTTLADALPDLCEGMFVRRARFHWRPGILPRLGAMLGRAAPDGITPHGQRPHGVLLSLLVSGYYWLDFVVGGWLRIAPVRLRGGLVVMERGWWDLAVDPRRYRLNVPGPLIRALGVLVPKPDLAFVLETEPSIVRARKAELPENELARQTAAWRRALPRTIERSVVNTSRGEAAVGAEARATLVDHLERRATARLAWGWASLPTRRSGRWLLPRAPNRAATGALVVFQPMNLRGRAGWEAARLLSALGAARLLPRGPAPPRSVRERLAPHMPPRSTLAVARANHPGRFVALIVGEDGRASRIAKVATDPRAEAALDWEADAIDRFGPLLSAPLVAPTVVDREPGLLLLEAERWHPRLRPWQLDREVWVSLGRFYAAGSEGDGSKGPAHGDLAPWNLLRTGRGWVVIDWEYAFEDAPALYDLFHFLLQSAGHLHRPSIDQILHDLRTGEGWIGSAVRAYVEGADIAYPSVRGLFVRYLVVSRDRLLGQYPIPGGDLELRDRLLSRLGS